MPPSREAISNVHALLVQKGDRIMGLEVESVEFFSGINRPAQFVRIWFDGERFIQARPGRDPARQAGGLTLSFDLPQQEQDRLLACVDMVKRTGAKNFQMRFSDDEDPVVWIAIAGYADERYEAEASTASPTVAAYRLCERLVDGALCHHCNRPTGIDESFGPMPLDDLFCWYLFDPELKTFRRSCEGET